MINVAFVFKKDKKSLFVKQKANNNCEWRNLVILSTSSPKKNKKSAVETTQLIDVCGKCTNLMLILR